MAAASPNRRIVEYTTISHDEWHRFPHAPEQPPVQGDGRTPQWTTPQRALWAQLQREENRTLTVKELCRRAGYTGTAYWYAAIKDPAFRAMVEALGVPIARNRQDRPIYGVVPLADDPDAEWAQDRVDLRRLVAEYPRHLSASQLKLDFSFMANPVLKALIKRYFRARLGFWEPASLKAYLQYMKPFLQGLSDTYPVVASFASLTRDQIEPLLHRPYWTDAKGRKQAVSDHRRLFMVLAMDGMLRYMQRHGWNEAPRQWLIFHEDKPKLKKVRPRPIPESVLAQLHTCLHQLHPYARNLVAILSVAGLRTEDALHLTEDCLTYDAAGDPRLHWYNHKLKREGRPLPVTQDVVAAIMRQRELVRTVPDHFGKKYLFRTPRGLYRFRQFCRHLNDLAELAPIRGLTGEIYRFKPHQFRHTVGTQMINNGLGIADVMAYLDHLSPEMTLRYAEIQDEMLKAKFKQLITSGRAVGGLALDALQEQIAKGDESELDWVAANLRRLSLPWGYCLHHPKAPKCPHGQNACFTLDNGPCHKLVTTPEHKPVIIATLNDLKKSHAAAQEKGWEMYANDLADQIKGMEQVVRELNRPDGERQSNRGGVR